LILEENPSAAPQFMEGARVHARGEIFGVRVKLKHCENKQTKEKVKNIEIS
jgi:hypothetical protein